MGINLRNFTNPIGFGTRDAHAQSAESKQPLLSDSSHEPTASSSPAERAKYCNEKMRTFSFKAAPEQVSENLKLLARQLGHLESEKSVPIKAVELTTKTVGSMGLSIKQFPPAAHPAKPIAGYPTNAARLKSSHSSELTHFFATPQKRTFDFLMAALGPSKNRDTLVKYPVFKQAKVKVKVKDFAPSEQAVNQRKTLAPVWEEMWPQARSLKPERQDKMLATFAANFDDFSKEARTDDNGLSLPKRKPGLSGPSELRRPVRAENAPQLSPDQLQSEKKALVKTFGTAFANLAKALPDLADPAARDAVSARQKQAIFLLTELVPYMQPEQLAAVRDGLAQMTAQCGTLHHLSVGVGFLHEEVKARIANPDGIGARSA